MERWRRKIKVNREGASFVSVVIGVLFMVAIGMTILTVANNYLTSVHVDENSADNFYQSEGILEEIRTGLLEKAGDAAKEAYVHSLEHYTSERKSVKATFAKNYFNGLIKAIGGDPYGWGNEDIGKSKLCSLDEIQKLTKKPSAVKTKPGTADDRLTYVMNRTAENSYTLTLKNLFIDYTDDAGYRSTVGTDIVFHVPDYQFEGDSTFDVLKDYVSISDGSLVVDTPLNDSAKAEVTGNVFAGKSIQVMDQRNVDFKCNTMISREDLEVKTGSEVNVTGESGLGEVWLRNIRLKSTGTGSKDSTKFSMNTNAYIANDLDIADNNSVVTLKGRYYGFSYNKENESNQPCNQADYSSAVLVNGVNTTLNASDLDKLVLAGRAFVAQKDNKGNAKESNIILGESISVKSNQIAYLVPDAYMPGDHNPVVIDDVTEEFEGSVKKRLLDSASPLKKYLNEAEPFTVNYIPNNYAYFFLNFSSEKKANQYFKDCYMDLITGTDEDGQVISDNGRLKENAKSYLMSTDMTNNRFSGNLYLLAGNAVYNYASVGKDGMQEANYYDASGEPLGELVLDGKKKALNYLGKCLTLQDSGSEGRDKIRMKQEYNSSETEDNMVYGGILSASVLDSVKGQQSYHVGNIVVSSGNYTIGTEKTGLIIAKGDVNVEADFTGLILAGGKVSIQRNCTLKSDMITIGKLLEAIDKDESLKEVKKLFTALNGKAKPATTKLEKCVTYQNWQKSE